jgi:DNA-binding NarL/FixJ family response regulator
MSRARVLLAEDHPGVAEELRRLLEREFEVIAVVADGDALLRVAAETDPDVVVTDIAMPRCDGIRATELLVAQRPGARVVLVTVHDDPELAQRGYAAGALVCVLKLTAAHDLVPAVRAALRGERYVASPGSGKRPQEPGGEVTSGA